MEGAQLSLEGNEFVAPPDLWSEATKTPDALKHCICYRCMARPISSCPLTPGWLWDTLEPNNHWVFCPACQH